ncbi:MAG: hypothetical protein K8W52_13335 [Deltaproteobacteria bacterium]|nr:hypothetical protein [Deltaproteobacteria bacterium]
MSDDAESNRGMIIFMGLVVVAIGGGIVWGMRRSSNAREPFAADDYLARAFGDAAARDAQAQLQRLEISRVDPGGRVHTEHDGELRAVFVTPNLRTDGEEPVMLGAPHRAGGQGHTLSVHVHLYEDEGASLEYDVDTSTCSSDCGPSAPGRLGCSVVEVWQRAITRGAPSPALADLELLTTKGTRTWRFTITDRITDGPSREVFATEFPDACR